MDEQIKKTILIVDDERRWRELFVELLEDEFDVTEVATHDEAQAKIDNQNPPFNVLVTDIRLNDEDKGNEKGLFLVANLKKSGKLTKVVVVTGYHSPRIKKRALEDLAAFAYLEKKDFDHNNFCELVSKAAKKA